MFETMKERKGSGAITQLFEKRHGVKGQVGAQMGPDLIR